MNIIKKSVFIYLKSFTQRGVWTTESGNKATQMLCSSSARVIAMATEVLSSVWRGCTCKGPSDTDELSLTSQCVCIERPPSNESLCCWTEQSSPSQRGAQTHPLYSLSVRYWCHSCFALSVHKTLGIVKQSSVSTIVRIYSATTRRHIINKSVHSIWLTLKWVVSLSRQTSVLLLKSNEDLAPTYTLITIVYAVWLNCRHS